MRVFLVDLFSGRIEDFNTAKRRLDRFREPNPHRLRRGMYFASDSRIGALQKGMRAYSRGRQKYQKTEGKDATKRVHLFREATRATHKTILLWSDSHLPNHAQLVMYGADVREDSGVRESDAETCHAKGQLWQPAPFLKRLNDEPRVGAVGSGSDDGVPGPIRIDCYVGGRIPEVHRLGPEGNGMREKWTRVIPFDRLTGMDSDILVGKAHTHDGAGAACRSCDLCEPRRDSQW